jgi:Flp pilus assembly protein TadB
MLKKEDEHNADQTGKAGRGGHGHWLMLACCVPMLVVVGVLVATSVVSAGFIVAAIACVGMMGAMMFAMSR